MLLLCSLVFARGGYRPPIVQDNPLKVGRYTLAWIKSSVSGDPPGYWGGGGSTFPVISRMSLYLAKAEILVPRSAYSDLARVLYIKGVRSHDGCIITIRGGDASESYIATIVVKRDSVVSRFVRNPILSKYWNETTKYTNHSPPDN